MFMTAHEINQHKKGDYEYGGMLHPAISPTSFLEMKKGEADNSGLTTNIHTEGVKEPLTIWHHSREEGGHKTLTDGHHRLAVMLEHNPHQMLPVQHEDLTSSPHLRPWS